jgi:hypothetical protein
MGTRMRCILSLLRLSSRAFVLAGVTYQVSSDDFTQFDPLQRRSLGVFTVSRRVTSLREGLTYVSVVLFDHGGAEPLERMCVMLANDMIEKLLQIRKVLWAEMMEKEDCLCECRHGMAQTVLIVCTHSPGERKNKGPRMLWRFS